MTDQDWCEAWMIGFMAALFLNSQGGRGEDWLKLRDEYLDKRNKGSRYVSRDRRTVD